MNRNNKAAAGVGILAALAISTVLAVAGTAEGAKAPVMPKPALTASTSTVWGSLPSPAEQTTTTSSTAAPQIVKPVTTNRQIVKPANKPVASRVTTSTIIDTTPEVEGMGEDFVSTSPLLVAQTYVGKPNQWGSNWCAKFVSAMAQEAGVPNWTSRPGPSALWADAMKEDRIHPLPQVGDMGFADLRDPSTRASEFDTQVMHVFIVEAVEGNTIHTIEGNADDTQLVVRNVRLLDDGMTIAFASFLS